MLKLSFISKNTRETDNTLEKSTKILYDACIGSPGASLSCLRGYKSNMAPGTVKRAIEGQKRVEKFAILTRKPRSHA